MRVLVGIGPSRPLRAVLVALLVGLGLVAAPVPAPPAGAVGADAGAYRPLGTPVLAFDGTVGAGGAGAARVVVAGSAAVPAGATGVAVQVHVQSAEPTEVKVFGADDAAAPLGPTVLLARPGRATGWATVRLPTSGPHAGALRVWSSAGGARVQVQVDGWFGSSTDAGGFVPVEPTVIHQARVGLGGPGSVDVSTLGAGGLASSRVRAVALRVHATASDPSGPVAGLYVMAADSLTLPPVETMVVEPDAASTTSVVIVRVGSGAHQGKVRLRSTGQPVDVRVEALGWVDLSRNPAGFVPTRPLRILDTAGTQRNTISPEGDASPVHVGPLTAGRANEIDLKVSPSVIDATGQAAIPAADVSTVAAQVTVELPTPAAGPAKVWVWSSGSPRPAEPILVTHGTRTSTQAVLRLGSDSRLRFATDRGPARVTVDVVGWFDAEYQDRGPLRNRVYSWSRCDLAGNNCRLVNQNASSAWTTNRDCGYSVPTIDGRRFWVFCDTAFHATLPPYFVATGGFPTSTFGIEPAGGTYGDVTTYLINGRPQPLIPAEGHTGITCNPGEYKAVWPRSLVSMPGVRADGSQTIMVFYQSACITSSTSGFPVYRHGPVGVARIDYRPGDPRLSDPPTSSARLQAKVLTPPSKQTGSLFLTRWGEEYSYEFGGITDNGWLYLYRCGEEKPCTIARFSLWAWSDAKIADPAQWQYLARDGSWRSNPNTAPIYGDASPKELWGASPDDAATRPTAGVTVNRANGKLVMTYMAATAPRAPLDRLMVVKTADTPVGPWEVAGTFLLPNCAKTVADLSSGRPVGCYAPMVHYGHPDQGLRLAVTYYSQTDLRIVMPDGSIKISGRVRMADVTLRYTVNR